MDLKYTTNEEMVETILAMQRFSARNVILLLQHMGFQGKNRHNSLKRSKNVLCGKLIINVSVFVVVGAIN